MEMTRENKPVMSVRIDADLLRRIDALVEATGVGRADIVERCLYLGLANQEEFVRSLRHPLTGELAHLLTYPGVMRVLAKALGSELDPIALRVRDGVAAKRRSKHSRGHGRVALEGNG